MISQAEADRVKAAARELGFDLAAFTHAEVPVEDRDLFLEWCREGAAGDMAWLTRAPAARAEPRAFFPEALGLITLGVSYFQGAVPPPPAAPSGRVARYAWGEDYHDVIAARLSRFEQTLKEIFGPGFRARNALDAQPLLERAFARRAGLGFSGKNTNLIAPRAGSWIFLAELVVNLELPPDSPVLQGCGACVQCQSACPTDALAVPFRLDARKCIAYHTIENRGWIPRDMRPRMGGWLFGCDDCQDVCPFNARAKETSWPELRAERGAGPWVPLAEVLSLRTQEQFKARFKGTPLLRAKRTGLVRNACVSAANTGAAGALRSLLEDCLRHDPEPAVRGHAAWALAQEPGRQARQALDRAWAVETDLLVKEEISFCLEAA